MGGVSTELCLSRPRRRVLFFLRDAFWDDRSRGVQRRKPWNTWGSQMGSWQVYAFVVESTGTGTESGGGVILLLRFLMVSFHSTLREIST